MRKIHILQAQVIRAAGRGLSAGKLIKFIESSSNRTELLEECTLAFCCTIPGREEAWEKLKSGFLTHYEEELAILFPGNHFLCRPCPVAKEVRQEFVRDMASIYRRYKLGKPKLPHIIGFIRTHFYTGYSIARMMDILFNKKK